MRSLKPKVLVSIVVGSLALASYVLLKKPAAPAVTASVVKVAEPDPRPNAEGSDETEAAPAAINRSQEPVRQEETLEIMEAMHNFDESFATAVDQGRFDFATQLVLRKMLEHSQDASELYEWLSPFLSKNEFLWGDSSLLLSYWSACVATDCNRQELLAKFTAKNPQYVKKEQQCLTTWAEVMDIIEKRQRFDTTSLPKLFLDLKECIAVNGVDDDAHVSLVQYFLSIVNIHSGSGAAQEHYLELKEKFPQLPELDRLIGKARS